MTNNIEVLRGQLEWIVRNLDEPEKAARHTYRGIAAIKHVAQAALAALGGKGEAKPELCGCGNPAEYMTTDGGWCCNKFSIKCQPQQPEAQAVPVAWQRRYGNGRYKFASGSLWSEWHDWAEDERPAMSGQWTNEYRPLYTTPPAKVPEGVVRVEVAVVSELMDALHSFASSAEDDESYTVPSELMSRLAMLGAVYRAKREGWYYLTDFGRMLLAAAPAPKEGV